MPKVTVRPNPVKSIKCPKCGELQVKIYPYSSYQLQIGIDDTIACTKCLNKLMNKSFRDQEDDGGGIGCFWFFLGLAILISFPKILELIRQSFK